MESKLLTGVCGLHSEGELSGCKTGPWTPLNFLSRSLSLASFSQRLLNQTIFQPAPEELNYSLVEN